MLRSPAPLFLLLIVLIALQRTHARDPFATWEAGDDDEGALLESAVDPHSLKEMDLQVELHSEQEEDTERYEFDDEAAERAAFLSQFVANPPDETPDDTIDSQDDTEAQHEDRSPERQLREEEEGATYEEDDPDAFAALEGIDLSPFHMHFADKAVLARLVDWAYDRAAHLSRFHDGFVHAEELGGLFGLALNPTGTNVPPEYEELLEAAAANMRATQGLLEGETPVPRGFVGRGMPLRTLQQLAQQMHELYSEDQRRRRLEEL